MTHEEKEWDDMKLPKLTILPWVIWASIVGAVILYLGIVLPAHAEEVPVHVFEDEGVTLQLFAAPCENVKAKATAANSPLGELADKLQRATSNWLVMPLNIRMDFAGCWVAYTHNGVKGYAVAFEDGEIRFFKAEGFKKVKGGVGA